MKKTKILAMCLVTTMITTVFSGCGKNAEVTTSVGDFTDTDEKLTIKWLGYPRNPGAEEGSVPELTLEEKFNVEIEPLFYEENKYNDKKTMLMTGGEIPDLIYELDPINVQQDVDQDFIVDVPYEVIKKYAPTYYEYLNTYAPNAWLYSRYEDMNYGLPNVNHSHMLSKNAIFRQDWLDKLGLEVPKTLDEYHDVLYKFANDDPDGNGKKDTYGMSSPAHYHGFFTEIFGAYGCMPFDWQEVDGKIVYGGTREECLEALKLLAQWYKEGIINPDFAIDANVSDAFKTGKIGYMCEEGFFDLTSSDALPNVLKENNPSAKISLGYLPQGADGKSGARGWGRACHIIAFGKTEGYEKKIPRILQMIEGMFTDKDLYIKCKLGNEGESWEKAPENTIGENSFQMIGQYADSVTLRKAGLTIDMAGPSMFAPIATDYDTYMSTKSNEWKEWAKKWTDEKYVLTDYFNKADVVPSASEYLVDLRTKQIALMSEIIQGMKPIEAYSEFVNQWNNGNGKILTDEANELKDTLKDIYNEIGIKEN